MRDINAGARWSRDDKQSSQSLPTTTKGQDVATLHQCHQSQESVTDTHQDGLDVTASENTKLLSPGSESAFERYTSCRWILAYLLGVMSMLVYCQRSCLNMALVCIYSFQGKGDPTGQFNTSSEGNTSHTAVYIPQEKEGVVLSGYFYGYFVTPFVTGILLGRLNLRPKRLLSVSMTISVVLTLLTPFAVRWNVELTVALRVVLGLAAGSMVPCVTALLGWWSTKKEMAKLMGLALSGSSTGYLLANVASGFMCSIPVDEGWPFIFYTSGLLMAVWVFIWECVCCDTPESHPRITSKEKSLIQQNRRIIAASASDKKHSPPWRSVWTSGPFLSLCMGNVAIKWLQCVLSLYTPFFLSQQLHYSVSTSGMLSSVPYLSRVLFHLIFSMLIDHIHATSLVSLSANRKFFQTIGQTVSGGMLVGVGYLGAANPGVSVVMVIISTSFQAVGQATYEINPLDLAPRYAGTLSGIAQTFGGITQFVCPLIFSAVVADDLPSSWASAFNITGIVALLGAVIFIAFGSGKQQPWAE